MSCSQVGRTALICIDLFGELTALNPRRHSSPVSELLQRLHSGRYCGSKQLCERFEWSGPPEGKPENFAKNEMKWITLPGWQFFLAVEHRKTLAAACRVFCSNGLEEHGAVVRFLMTPSCTVTALRNSAEVRPGR